MVNVLGKSFLLIFMSLGCAFAQSNTTSLDSAEVKKVYRPWTTFASLRAEKLFAKGSSLYGELSYAAPKAYTSLNEAYKSFLWIGYEQAFTTKWYGGISGRVNFVEQGTGSFFTRLNFAHRGQIGKFFLYKEASFEHLFFAEAPNYKRKAEGRFSPSIGLGRNFNVAGKALYVGINYRFFINFDFEDDKRSLYDKRKIDRTKLRIDVAYQFLPHWSLGIYYLRDTEYYYTLAQFDANNKQIVPDYKLNQITEGLGVTLTYLLFKEKPDQYIPGLPSR
jgi:hypothetical protein